MAHLLVVTVNVLLRSDRVAALLITLSEILLRYVQACDVLGLGREGMLGYYHGFWEVIIRWIFPYNGPLLPVDELL